MNSVLLNKCAQALRQGAEDAGAIVTRVQQREGKPGEEFPWYLRLEIATNVGRFQYCEAGMHPNKADVTKLQIEAYSRVTEWRNQHADT